MGCSKKRKHYNTQTQITYGTCMCLYSKWSIKRYIKVFLQKHLAKRKRKRLILTVHTSQLAFSISMFYFCNLKKCKCNLVNLFKKLTIILLTYNQSSTFFCVSLLKRITPQFTTKKLKVITILFVY